MNNIEINQLKRDIKDHLGYTDEQVEDLGVLSDTKLHALKREIAKVKDKKEKTSRYAHSRNLIEKKVNNIFKNNPKLKSKQIIGRGVGGMQGQAEAPRKNQNNQDFWVNQGKPKKIEIKDRKPRILFVSDVKGWAWWIKSHFLKQHLSDEFDIDVKCVLGEGSIPANRIDHLYYDLYFTYGFSYIDAFARVPKNKKATGITAHRRKNVIFPKMKMAGHIHANSKMLLKELHEMGFKNAYYIPNGVDETLFKPIQPIRKEGKLVVGHVGKECPAKGQREYILPAIQTCKVQSATNLRTWKDRLPHTEMPQIYNQMDVFVVSSIEDGTPNPALEAAACGRPIISNPIGNMPELIRDGWNGFLVPRKIGAYVEKINYFKNNRDELIRMGNNARKSILAEWTWKHQSENYRNMFREIFK